MEIFEEGKEVIIVTNSGVIKGKIGRHVNDKYYVHTYTAADVVSVKESHVYPISDFRRACNFFKSRYL